MEATKRTGKAVSPFFEIEGCECSIEVYYNLEKGFDIIGMKPPE